MWEAISGFFARLFNLDKKTPAQQAADDEAEGKQLLADIEKEAKNGG